MINKKKKIASVALVVYCISIFWIQINPHRAGSNWLRLHGSYDFLSRMNLVPFKGIIEYVSNCNGNYALVFNNIGMNILAFIPLGFILQSMDFDFKKCVWFSVIMRLIMEMLQLVLYVGVFDIDDVILNTIGCIVGFYISGIVWKRYKNENNKKAHFK